MSHGQAVHQSHILAKVASNKFQLKANSRKVLRRLRKGDTSCDFNIHVIWRQQEKKTNCCWYATQTRARPVNFTSSTSWQRIHVTRREATGPTAQRAPPKQTGNPLSSGKTLKKHFMWSRDNSKTNGNLLHSTELHSLLAWTNLAQTKR